MKFVLANLECCYEKNKLLSENLKGKYNLEDQGVDGRIVLKWSIKKSRVIIEMDLSSAI
jgi:hypothetical protein